MKSRWEMDSRLSTYIAIDGLVASLLVGIALYIYCIKKRWKAVVGFCSGGLGSGKATNLTVVGSKASASILGTSASEVEPLKRDVQYVALYPNIN